MKARNVCIVALKRQRISGGICLVETPVDSRGLDFWGWIPPPPPPQAKKKGRFVFLFFGTGIHVKLRISKLTIFWRNEKKF